MRATDQYCSLTDTPAPSCAAPCCSAVWLKLPDEAVRQALIDVPLHLKHGDALEGYGVDAPRQLLCSPSVKKRRGRSQAGDVFTCDALSKAITGYQGELQQSRRGQHLPQVLAMQPAHDMSAAG